MPLVRERVVVPFDFGEAALGALKVARELVSGPSHLYVVHVVADGDTARDALARLDRALREAGFDGARPAVQTGDPATQICKHAERVGADLIVVPSARKSGVARMLMGSTAEAVVRSATCPVLVWRV